MEKILIVGPGAIGTAIGARLRSQGADVRWVGREEKKQEVLIHWDRAFELDQRVETHAPFDWKPDCAWITVRAPEFESALRTLSQAGVPGDRCWIATNGLGLWEGARARLGGSPIRVGVAFGASWESGSRLRCFGASELWIPSEIPRESEQILSQSGFLLIRAGSSRRVEWQKALVNLCINVLGALTGATNGELAASLEMREWMRTLFFEAIEVAREDGEVFEESEFEKILQVAEKTSDNRNSTWWDLKSGRMTEIPWLNGWVAERLERSGRNRSTHSLLSNLIKIYKS